MKKVLVLAFCAVAMLACGKKAPECDAADVTSLIIEQYWTQIGGLLGEEVTTAVKEIVQVTIEDVETVESTDIRKVCKANFVAKVTNEDSIAQLQEMMPVSKEDLESTDPISYTVTLSEDKKTFLVEATTN